MKASKPKSMLKHAPQGKRVKPTLGYSDVLTVKLDFDDKSLKTVKYWAKRVCKFFKLDGFLILRSSSDSYHVVFNRSVSWSRNVHIMNWAALMIEGRRLKNLPLTKYALMQDIKESSCLRIGKKKVEGKKEKPSPRTVFKFGKQNNEIKNYLQFKRNLRRFL
ncbi:MAG: hypothetical protein ABSC91_11660 [Candidatus Bathyarchaeia archaeon]